METPGASVRERMVQAREEVILEAAEAMIGERGLEAATMDALARHLHVSKITLYEHFRTKQEMARRVAARLLDDAAAALDAGDAAGPAADALERAMRALLLRLLRAPFGLVSLAFANEQLAEEPDCAAGRDLVEERIGTLIERAKADGAIAGDAATAALSRLPIVYATSPALRVLIDQDYTTPEALTETLIGALMHGIRLAG